MAEIKHWSIRRGSGKAIQTSQWKSAYNHFVFQLVIRPGFEPTTSSLEG